MEFISISMDMQVQFGVYSRKFGQREPGTVNRNEKGRLKRLPLP
jgi:hypothetical protein